MSFVSHCSDSTLDLKISTRVILHFPYGRIHVNLCSYCFPLSFLHSLSHCAPLLYAIALIVVAAGIGPDSIEFQLQCKLGHFQFLVWGWDSNVSKIQFLCIQAYRLMHPAVIAWLELPQNDKFNHSHGDIYPISGQESIVKSKGPSDMSAEAFLLCFSAERCFSTWNSGTRDKRQLPRQLKTQPS